MPRVTDEYRAARRAEIMAAAARLFSVNGFHATSMADIIAEAGMSAGAVYGYFRGKEELIFAVAGVALSAADEAFAKMLAGDATPAPAEAVATIIEAIDTRIAHDPDTGVDLTRIGVQVWAEALRNPQMLASAGEVYLRLRGNWTEVARRWQRAGNMPADADPAQAGAALLSLVQGFMLQKLLISGLETSDYLDGVRALLAAGPRDR
ncbi:TetR/AcrR family transcriptional regulator [Actinoplanes bogorensis]|uniref:TetR/AcrR family transcriptional regulator n=1 Tax=Paractinoplanes bogorensis TaxID=1610840 RepID=A0ABS5YZC1_9ACTN|nr:TetR/AcrR family transcriptional regulator [Actinoplanes bogorensis]MBU2668789.1 TetR/AcrR family transcriptional regulator [Actinoplanes bogorensis]